jgi:hypothetical protein
MVNDLTFSPDGGGYRPDWDEVLAYRFDSASFEELLRAYGCRFDPGGLAAELGKVLDREWLKRLPMAILLEELTKLPVTTRIDGILPFRIPQPVDVFQSADTLLDELKRMRYTVPEFGEELVRMRSELALCFLAALHRREFQIDHRLRMRVQVECPYSPTCGRKDSLMLMGYLPFGGRITIFYSNLSASKWLGVPGCEVEYESALTAVRDEGRLKLVPAGKTALSATTKLAY